MTKLHKFKKQNKTFANQIRIEHLGSDTQQSYWMKFIWNDICVINTIKLTTDKVNTEADRSQPEANSADTGRDIWHELICWQPSYFHKHKVNKFDSKQF